MSDVYVRLKYAKVAKTIEVKRLNSNIGDYNVDLDADGEVIGIEVVNALAVEVDGKEVA